MLYLHLGGQVIRTTHKHPFFVEGSGWTKASLLKPDDRVRCADGRCVLVEEYHTYFVGDEGWGRAAWAHNVYAALIADPHTAWDEVKSERLPR